MSVVEQIAYSAKDAAEACGLDGADITSAIQQGHLVARVLGNRLLVTRYDLEVWLLGLDDYVKTLPARQVKEQAEADRQEANRQARLRERAEAKAARAAVKSEQEAARAEEDAKLAADLRELERLRELTS